MNTKTTLSITQARKNIYDIAEKVQSEEKYFTLTERGVPKVVVMSAEKFESLLEKRKKLALADRGVGYSCHPQIIGRTLIIRDESRVVYLSGNDQNAKHQEESLIKAQLYVEIIEKYKYPLSSVEFGRYVKVGLKESKRYIEADLIINDDKGNVRMIIEVGCFADYEKNIDRIAADLFEISDSVSWVKKPEYLVYFSRNCRENGPQEKIIVIDNNRFNTFRAWKKAGRPFGRKIPMFIS